MQKFLAMFVALLIAGVAQAVTVTNQGQVFTIDTLAGDAHAGTATKASYSKLATGEPGSYGMIVINYAFPGTGSTGAIDIATEEIPKGAILLDNAVVEVTTACTPTSTVAVAVGGVDIVAAGTDLNSTGIKAAVATTGITTSKDEVTLTISGAIVTNGEFTVYVPYIMGLAQ